MALARTWRTVSEALDASHGSAASIGHTKDSNGRFIDLVMWRANRLVDILAKLAAARCRLLPWALSGVQDAGKLFAHHAARLGTVTYNANNYRQDVLNEEGQEVFKLLRDSTAKRPWVSRKALRSSPPGILEASSGTVHSPSAGSAVV